MKRNFPLRNNFYDSELNLVSTIDKFSKETILEIKIQILIYGIVITNEAMSVITATKKIPQSVRSGASNGLDIVLPSGVWVNAPVSRKSSDDSALILDFKRNTFCLEKRISSIKRDIPVAVVPRPDYYGVTTTSNIPMNQIGQIFADRIGFGLINNCYFWKKERRCAFCSIGVNVENEIHTKRTDDIIETLLEALRDNTLPPKHILISGGTFPQNGWSTKPFSDLAKQIRQHTDIPIYLMAVPPVDLSELSKLKESGVSEIALNIEIFSPTVAKKIIPGKFKEVGVAKYLDAIRESRRYWSVNQVRSLLVAGLETMQSTLEGVSTILDAGATPILSAFRPLNGSMLANQETKKPGWFLELYYYASELASNYGLTLGPECNACAANCIA